MCRVGHSALGRLSDANRFLHPVFSTRWSIHHLRTQPDRVKHLSLRSQSVLDAALRVELQSRRYVGVAEQSLHVLAFVPALTKNVARLCRRLWNPNRRPGSSITPALIAAGRR